MKRLFRKVHLWLSVPLGIFITLICFSGSMLVFEKEISEWCDRDLYFVDKVGEAPLPLDRLMTDVAATLPDGVTITGVTISDDASRNYQVALSQPRRASLYVDQYTGEVKGQSRRLPFFDTMFHLHRWLMGSSDGTGKLIVGISTLALVIILITGLLMWLTNRKKPLAKSLKISVTNGWPRFWHDLHVAGGIYATIFLLAMALTGLTWSFKWYRTGFYSMFGVETVADNSHGGGGQRAEVHTTRQSGEAPAQERREGRGNRSRHDHDPESVGSRPPYMHWQQICDRLVQENPGYRYITISDAQASVVPAGRTSMRAADKFDFDKRTGEITGNRPYDSSDRAAKVRSAVYTVHVGSWGGLLTRILTFLSALLGATLPLTGYYLWIRRLVKRRQHKDDKA